MTAIAAPALFDASATTLGDADLEQRAADVAVDRSCPSAFCAFSAEPSPIAICPSVLLRLRQHLVAEREQTADRALRHLRGQHALRLAVDDDRELLLRRILVDRAPTSSVLRGRADDQRLAVADEQVERAVRLRQRRRADRAGDLLDERVALIEQVVRDLVVRSSSPPSLRMLWFSVATCCASVLTVDTLSSI